MAAKKTTTRSKKPASAGAKARPSRKPAAKPARKVASAKAKTTRKRGAAKAGGAKGEAAGGAKKTPRKSAAPARAKRTAKKTPARKPAFTAAQVNLGHVFALRPRVSTAFRPEDFRTAKHRLREERFKSLDAAARAVVEQAHELGRAKPRFAAKRP